MVYYYTSSTVSPAAYIYAGKDKFESKNSISVDSKSYTKIPHRWRSHQVWFRRRCMVSRRQVVERAYLSSHEWGRIMGDYSRRIVDGLCATYESQFYWRWELISEKSVSHVMICEIGNKKDNITIIYTPWSNLKKDGSMAVGQVSFKNQKTVGSWFCQYSNVWYDTEILWY